ncbi:hypothetical protein ABZ917_31190 [Nonomuraea wenchangensis]
MSAPTATATRAASSSGPLGRLYQDLRGQVFCAFHFAASRVNALISSHADTVTSCPEDKVTAVRLRKPFR